ncbi:unnamed protein product [Closterium sp. NIES-64]|nr:unnamed protein product [Closterium sp. NIES-64]
MDRRDRPDLTEEVIPALMDICEAAADAVVEWEAKQEAQKEKERLEKEEKEKAEKEARAKAEEEKKKQQAEEEAARKAKEAAVGAGASEAASAGKKAGAAGAVAAPSNEAAKGGRFIFPLTPRLAALSASTALAAAMAAALNRRGFSLARTALPQLRALTTSAQRSAVGKAEAAEVSGIPKEQLQRKVVVYSPARAASQQGMGRHGQWKIRFDTTQKWENPLMGWTSTADPMACVADSALSFHSKQDAVDFVERHGWHYQVCGTIRGRYVAAPSGPRAAEAIKKARLQGDQCALLAEQLAATARVVPGTVGVGFATPSQAKHCLRSFRFQASRDIPVIDSIINGLANFYVYRHIAINSPDELLLEGLDVAALVLHQFDYYRYEGAQVMTINGAPAMEYLLEVVSKATGAVIATQGAFAQRSLAPTNDSVVVELILATSATPVLVTVPWVAVLPTNFDSATSYWAANCATPRQPTASAAAASAPAAASAAAAAAAEGSRGIGAAGVDLGARKAAAESTEGAESTLTGNGAESVGSAENAESTGGTEGTEKGAERTVGAGVYLRAENATAVYLLADNATAVIWLHTFLPAMDGSDEALIAFLLTEISTAVDLANQHGKRIIMDVSGNGGGYADIAYLLLRLVAGKQKAPKGRVQMPQQLLISNAFMLSLLDKQLTSFYQWDKYVKVDEATPVKSVRDFKPFLEETFSPDGETGVYSGLFKLAAFPGLEKVPFRGPVFGARPLVIVTNGNCFSACAIFTHNLRKRFNVKHVTVGGVLGQPLGISASCMGATMPSLETGVTNFLTGTKLANHPRAPKPFPYNVVQGVAVVQGYVEDKVPCEYVFLPGDQHVDLTMDKVANPALVWTEASQYY